MMKGTTAMNQEMRKQLLARFKSEWLNKPGMMKLYEGSDRAFAAITALEIERRARASTGEYSEKGVQEGVRKFAADKTVKELKDAATLLDAAKSATDTRRAQLWPVKIDNTDMARAMLRWQVRDELKQLAPGDAIKRLLEDRDELAIEAYFEAPSMLPMIPADVGTRLRDVVMENADPELAREIAEQAEAIELAETCLSVALDALQGQLGMEGKASEFDAWMDENAGMAAADRGNQDTRGANSFDADFNAAWNEVASEMQWASQGSA